VDEYQTELATGCVGAVQNLWQPRVKAVAKVWQSVQGVASLCKTCGNRVQGVRASGIARQIFGRLWSTRNLEARDKRREKETWEWGGFRSISAVSRK
jgi:hypothetical protein